MSPINHTMNFSAELSQRESFFPRHISSRLINITCFPLELLAALENTIKLPFQTATLAIKIPAKILNVVVRSKSLKEFESALASPLKVLETALKIVGYVVGSIFTLTLGTISPHKNFKMHCLFDLIVDKAAAKAQRIAEEKKKQETEAYEKVLGARLNQIIDAMRKKAQTIQQLSEEQLKELESFTKVPCPPLQEIRIEPTPSPKPTPVPTQEVVATVTEKESPARDLTPSPIAQPESPIALVEEEEKEIDVQSAA